MNLIDTHAHLDFSHDIEGWLERAGNEDMRKIICVGTSVKASRKCVEIAEKYSNKDSGQARTSVARMTKDTGLQIYATVGIHAQDGKEDIEKYGSLGECIEELRKILRSAQNDRREGVQNDSKKVVAVGECGFDYYLVASGQKPVTSEEEKEFQKELFEAQIQLAVELKLPLIVHCRDAWEETFELLDSISAGRPARLKSSQYTVPCGPRPSDCGPRRSSDISGTAKLSADIAKQVSLQNDKGGVLRGVFHSWTGDWEAAKKALDLGFYIAFSGIVTFKNAPNVQEVAKKMPLDRMLLETDSPFLAPEPIRGSKNEPKNVRIIADFVAELRNLPVDQICDITSENAERLFSL